MSLIIFQCNPKLILQTEEDEEKEFDFRVENGGGALFTVNSDGYVLLNTDQLDYEDEAFQNTKEVRFTVSMVILHVIHKYKIRQDEA